MRFVIVNHSYERFLESLYATTPDLARQPFATQLSTYYASHFGSADFYAHALQSLGHEVHEFVCNNTHAQLAWQREFLGSCNEPATLWQRIRERASAPFALLGLDKGNGIKRDAGRELSQFELLVEQVRTIRPDVLYNQSVYAFDNEQLRALKKHIGLLVGEHAAMPLPESIDYRMYDLIVSSFPPTLDWLRQRGAHAELNRLGFDPRVAALIPTVPRDIRVSFVGSFFAVHRSRLDLVQAIAAEIGDIIVHGEMTIDLEPASPLKGRIGPPLWGREMYLLLRRSLVTLNHHGNVPPFANNMRLYEATGMGALLVTDYKQNLVEMFEPEKEVITYRDTAECVDKVRFYLDEGNRGARERIMAAGQKRTLGEHTYKARMARLVELVRAL